MYKESNIEIANVDPSTSWPIYRDYKKLPRIINEEWVGSDGEHKIVDNGEFDPETGMQIIRHEIIDPYASESEENFRYISSVIEKFEMMGWQGDGNPEPDLQRRRKGDIDYNNPSTRAFIESASCAIDWLDIMPSANALEPLYNPNITHYSNGKPVSPEATVFFKNCMDAIGMRNRGKMTSWLIEQEARDYDYEDPFVVYSLGCGAAVPVLDGLDRFRSKTKTSPQATLVDLDRRSLDSAGRYADSLDLRNVRTRRLNIMKQSGIADSPNWFKNNIAMRAVHKKGKLEPRKSNITEAIGVLEYLKPEDWPYKYKGLIDVEVQMAGAVSFLKNASELVKPGGKLIVGNMFIDRPQLAFTLNTIQWPHIQPRSPRQMNEIFDAADLPKKRTLHVSSDHLYGLYVMDFS